MTEELEKEIRKYLKKTFHHEYYDDVVMVMGFAEPREKQIEIDAEQIRALQKQNGELTDKVKELEEKLANADYQLEGRDLEIKELKAQIEKMKCCANCQTVRDTEGNCYLKKDGKCKDKDNWELREIKEK